MICNDIESKSYAFDETCCTKKELELLLNSPYCSPLFVYDLETLDEDYQYYLITTNNEEDDLEFVLEECIGNWERATTIAKKIREKDKEISIKLREEKIV